MYKSEGPMSLSEITKYFKEDVKERLCVSSK